MNLFSIVIPAKAGIHTAVKMDSSFRWNDVIIFTVAAFLLTACGHSTPLIKPSDIPAYEQKRKEKLEKYAPYKEPKDAWYEGWFD